MLSYVFLCVPLLFLLKCYVQSWHHLTLKTNLEAKQLSMVIRNMTGFATTIIIYFSANSITDTQFHCQDHIIYWNHFDIHIASSHSIPGSKTIIDSVVYTTVIYVYWNFHMLGDTCWVHFSWHKCLLAVLCLAILGLFPHANLLTKRL